MLSLIELSLRKKLELSPSAIVNSEIREPSAQDDVNLCIKDLLHFQEVTF